MSDEPRVTVKVIGAADGSRTPHDGRYVKAWSPHTRYGTLACLSTANRDKAHRFDKGIAFTDWKTVSLVQPTRPDGEPNRPLAALNILLEDC